MQLQDSHIDVRLVIIQGPPCVVLQAPEVCARDHTYYITICITKITQEPASVKTMIYKDHDPFDEKGRG